MKNKSTTLLMLSLLLSPSQVTRAADEVATPQAPIVFTLEPFIEEHTLAGAVTLVANKDKILDVGAIGYSDIAAKKPMKVDDLFWIASMSKPMTATALMMLVDEGKVNVEDPVEKYLPEFRGQMLIAEQDKDHVLLKHPSHPIKVHEVLSHTSGLPFSSRIENQIDTRPLREAVVSYAMTPLKTDPGTHYDYSNAGINTAGRIIEVVSGMPYEQFMQERLFKPLGMKDTVFILSDEQLTRLAKSYKADAAKTGLEETNVNQLIYPLTDGKKRYPCPAGGLFSTAADCAAFGRMILNDGTLDGKKYLSPAAIQQMTSTQTGKIIDKEHGEGGYGFGFSTTHAAHGEPGPDTLTACGHGGAYATDLQIDPEHKLVFVFMVQSAGYPNKDGGSINPTFRKAALAQFGK